MSDLEDAQTKLASALEAARAFLSTQDDPNVQAKAFGPLLQIQAAVGQLLKATVGQAALSAATEGDFDTAVHESKVIELRQDGARLAAALAELQGIVSRFAARARV